MEPFVVSMERGTASKNVRPVTSVTVRILTQGQVEHDNKFAISGDIMPPSDTFEDEDITIAATTTVRRRSGKAGDSDLVTTSLALSPRVIDHFKATGDDWQSR